MNTIKTIGRPVAAAQYVERPTVKVIIKKGDTILLLNDGLLPGGGVDEGEAYLDAIRRELAEELGATTRDVMELGTVIQYRNFLSKKYLVHGYSATLATEGGERSPQDEGEANFVQHWLSVEEAIVYVKESIRAAQAKPTDDDRSQGRLYNLMTTYELLKRLDSV